MTMLTYALGLVLTLLILYPFILLTSASIFSLYFKYKERHILNTVKTFTDIALETAKCMSAKKEKENA